jgi:hypothetical protein
MHGFRRYYRQLYGSTTPLTNGLFVTASIGAAAAGSSASPASAASGAGALTADTAGSATASAAATAVAAQPAVSRRVELWSGVSAAPQIVIDAHRTVHIPLKFQSFACGSVTDGSGSSNDCDAFPLYFGSRVYPVYPALQSRVITVSVHTLDGGGTGDGVCVALCRVVVRAQPMQIDRTFRFHHR